MKIYDITQELFSCVVYKGDPKPEREILMRVSEGDVCNLSKISLCVHNGTHVDAPYHFLDDGKTIDEISLEAFIGECYVFEAEGDISDSQAQAFLDKARSYNEECARRILIKGKAVVTEAAAEVFARNKVLLVGNESQTVGPENAPARVHNILLGAEVVLLEGIRLGDVPEGRYLLNAAPLQLAGADGAPCRAVLIENSFC